MATQSPSRLLLLAGCLLSASCRKEEHRPTPSEPPVTSRYATRGWRTDHYAGNGYSPDRTVLTPLRDSLLPIVRYSSDSLRVSGYLALPSTADPGFERLSVTNPLVYSVRAPAADATFLALYQPGDSVKLRQLSHVGHGLTTVVDYAGPRRP